jgi:hypothetical protein
MRDKRLGQLMALLLWGSSHIKLALKKAKALGCAYDLDYDFSKPESGPLPAVQRSLEAGSTRSDSGMLSRADQTILRPEHGSLASAKYFTRSRKY